MNSPNQNVIVRFSALLLAAFWILLLVYLLPVKLGDEFSWNAFLIDTESPMWPVTLQALMWVVFFAAFGEIVIRLLQARAESDQLRRFTLRDVLQDGELITLSLMPEIRKRKIRELAPGMALTTLFNRLSNQFQSSNNVGDAYNAVTSTLDLQLHRLDLRYSFIRYLAWLIPTLGFVGTVIGIALALGKAGALDPDDPEMLTTVIPLLSSAFYTTLLALIQSALVMYSLQLAQKLEEEVVADVASYCIDNVLTELYVEP